MATKIKTITDEKIIFENGDALYSSHDQDCCEKHFLDFSNVKDPEEWKDLEFDLSKHNFFNRLPGYGIELIPTNNFPFRIPGYGYNNGYYSDNLILVLETDGHTTSYDISECQYKKNDD